MYDPLCLSLLERSIKFGKYVPQGELFREILLATQTFPECRHTIYGTIVHRYKIVTTCPISMFFGVKCSSGDAL